MPHVDTYINTPPTLFATRDSFIIIIFFSVVLCIWESKRTHAITKYEKKLSISILNDALFYWETLKKKKVFIIDKLRTLVVFNIFDDYLLDGSISEDEFCALFSHLEILCSIINNRPNVRVLYIMTR